MLYLKSFTFNPFQQNTYLVYTDEGEALLIDAGNSTQTEHQQLSAFIEKNGLHIKRFLLTHAHIDHVLGASYVLEKYGLSPEVHKSELFFVDRMMQSATLYGLHAEQCPAPGAFLEEGQEIHVGKYRFTCLFAPGHSPGSICFYNAQNHLLIGGDVLFYGSIGRTDLPMGDHEQLLASIREKLLVLPPETKVYSGHGPATTIGDEKRSNPFLMGG